VISIEFHQPFKGINRLLTLLIKINQNFQGIYHVFLGIFLCNYLITKRCKINELNLLKTSDDIYRLCERNQL